MKKILLFLFVLLALPGSANVTSWVTFDFTNPAELPFNPALTSRDLDALNGSGDVLNVTNKTITFDDVTMSFGFGVGREGVAINHLLLDSDASVSVYSLSMRTKAVLTLSVPAGYSLDSIVFDGYMANMLKMDGEPGIYNLAMKTWSANGEQVEQVSFKNGQSYDTQIYSIKVKYTRPSTPLVLIQSYPRDGGETKSFRSMALQFNTPIGSIVKSDDITLTTLGLPVQKLVPTASGNVVTLSLPDNVQASSALYTVTVPAGCFLNTEGSPNDPITVKFQNRNPVMYESVSPAPGSVLAVPQEVTLTFKDNVKVAKGAVGTLINSTGILGSVSITQDRYPSTTVKLTVETVNTDADGTYVFYIPSGSIHNTFYSESAEEPSVYESWNEEYTITYTVEVIEPDELKAAKDLIKVSGIGYPSETSAARALLKQVIDSAQVAVNKGEEANIDSLKIAIGKFYTDTDVQLPAEGQWYYISNVNNAESQQKVFLAYANDSVSLTTDRTLASKFQMVVKDGKALFRTPDKKLWLSVLTDRDVSMGVTKSCTTTDSLRIGRLTLSKLSVEGVDSTKTFGKLCMNGISGLGDDMQLIYATSAINHASISIVEPSDDLFYDEEQSSAFTFTATSAPFDPQTAIYPELRLSPGRKTHAGDSLVLVVQNVASATLVKPEQLYYTKLENDNTVRVSFEGTILTPSETTPYEFNINTKGLAKAIYLLHVPEGTFKYEKLDKDVADIDMMVEFEIVGEGESVDPDPDDPDPDDPPVIVNPDDPDRGFQYTYNSQFACLQLLERLEHNISIIRDVDLNQLVLFAALDNPYTGMIPDTTKVVSLEDFYSGKVYRTGRLVPYPEFEEEYPEYFNVQAVKLELFEPIKYNDIREGMITYVLPRATIGDANYGLWLSDNNSVNPGDCIVNDRIDAYKVQVNNQLLEQTGITDASTIYPVDDTVYDLRGRRVAGQLKPGVYIINGHKRVVR